jgi:L-ascorbate metabolism protein UlaG (beta-lactamase superfamily)
MTPQHAIAAARVLGARLAVPIHYGLHDEGVYMEHPNAVQEFRTFAEKRSQPYRVVQPGEVFEVG